MILDIMLVAWLPGLAEQWAVGNDLPWLIGEVGQVS